MRSSQGDSVLSKASSVCVTLFVFTLTLQTLPVKAVNLDADALYFDPDSLALAEYARDYLYPTFDGVSSTGNSIQWAGDILGVNILPMLVPYSSSDPAGYPLGYLFSYSDYYYTPFSDYFVDLTDGVATATFNKAGIYHARLTREDGSVEIRTVLANAGTLGEDDRTSASVRIDGPVADLVLVSNPTGGDSTLEIANSNAVDENGADNVDRASSVADAVSKIEQAYHDNGDEKIHLEVVAHGRAGFFRLGDTGIGAGGSMSIAEFQKLIDEYVDEISVYACSFAADGAAGLQTLADSIGTATGFDKPVSVYRNWFGFSYGWDLPLGGKKITAKAPDSAMFPLIFISGWFIVLMRRFLLARSKK